MTEFLNNIHHIAIIRGVRPEEAVEITAAFYESGFRAIEVPLNSPDPLESIRRMVDQFGDKMLIGAGTVLSAEEVCLVADVGGRLIVSPNTNANVIAATQRLGLVSIPGVMTPTECFSALEQGADALKLFPAHFLGLDALRSYRAVLPPETLVYAVGGISVDNAQAWLDAGATGVGIGSCCYKPTMLPAQVSALAAEYFS